MMLTIRDYLVLQHALLTDGADARREAVRIGLIPECRTLSDYAAAITHRLGDNFDVEVKRLKEARPQTSELPDWKDFE